MKIVKSIHQGTLSMISKEKLIEFLKKEIAEATYSYEEYVDPADDVAIEIYSFILNGVNRGDFDV